MSIILTDTNDSISGCNQLELLLSNFNFNTLCRTGPDPSNSSTLSISKLSVLENDSIDTDRLNRRKFLTFHYVGSRNSIIEPDHFVMCVNTSSSFEKVANVQIDIKLQSAIISINNSSLSRWPLAVSTLASSLAPPSSPSLIFNLVTTIPDATVLVHPDYDGCYWNDLVDSIDISSNSSKWNSVMIDGDTFTDLTNHMNQSIGGLRITADNFSLSLSSLSTTILEMDSVEMKLFLETSSTYMETIIATANSDNGGNRVTIKQVRNSDSNIDDEFQFVNNNTNSKKNVDSVLCVEADSITIDIQQREYNALISICKGFSNSNNNINTDNKDDHNGFGIIVNSKTAIIALSQTNYKSNINNNVDDHICIFTTVLQPVIEFYVTAFQNSISMKAANISMYELTIGDLEIALAKDDGASDLKPFLHKSTFIGPNLRDEEMSSHALAFELIFNDEYDFTKATLNSKSITFILMFDDITLVYDPLSSWLLRFVDIMTPLSPKQILAKPNDSMNHDTAIYPYEVTNIAVSISKCLIDYSCIVLNSRSLITVGNLIISSTIVTNNPTYSLKFSVNDFNWHLSNTIIKNILLEQSPLYCTGTLPRQTTQDFDSFLVLNRFVDMFSIDHLENLITFQSSHNALSIKMNIGICSFGARIDSLDLLTSTLLAWLEDTKAALHRKENEEYFDTTDNIICPTQSPIKPITPLKANWLECVTKETFKPLTIKNNTSSFSVDENLKSQYAYQNENYETHTINENYLNTNDDNYDNDLSSGKSIVSLISTELVQQVDSEPETQARWLPQYDYDDNDDNGLDFGEKIDFEEFDVDSITEEIDKANEDDDDNCDEDTNANTSINRSTGGISFYDFYNQFKPKEVEELELKELMAPADKINSLQTVDSDTDQNEKNDEIITSNVNDSLFIDTKAKIFDYDDLPDDVHISLYEEKAIWLIDPASIVVQPHYISLTVLDDDDIDEIPDIERQLKVDTFISVKANLKITIYEGFDWTSESVEVDPTVEGKTKKKNSSLFEREKKPRTIKKVATPIPEFERVRNRDCLVISTTNANLRVRIYKNNKSLSDGSIESTDNDLNKSNFMSQLPAQRISINASDFLITFTRKEGLQKKIMGAWRSIRIPRQLNRPFFQFSLIGYESPQTDDKSILPVSEYRLEATMQPIRCFLDELVIDFIRNLSLHLSIVEAMKVKFDDDYHSKVNRNPELLYLQCICITPIEMKIDYTPGIFNVKSLRDGDYLQLLNILPIKGLELILMQTRLAGVSGIRKAFDLTVETWVRDIHKNQMLRLISGTSPFKGISSIGSSLHDLLVIPLNDYRKSGGIVKELSKSSTSLLKCVTKEALTASHQITMLLANGISELVRDSNEQVSLNKSLPRLKHGDMNHVTYGKVERQPRGLKEGISRAYQVNKLNL